MTRPRAYNNGEPWPDPCTHPSTHTRRIPAGGDYVDGGVSWAAFDVQVCDECGSTVKEEK